MRRGRSALPLALAAAAALGIALVVALQSSARPRVSAADYVGDRTCLSCHQEKESFGRTAHHLSSRPATAATIAGSFREGENVLRTPNPYLHYRMEATPAGFYQTAVVGEHPARRTRSQRFDIVIGSGRKGQSYLSWQDGNALVQLPVSYWTELRAWINSPGFQDGLLNFGRPATPRCLECHSSYFAALPDSGAVNRYDRTDFVLGIACERCHGPGREHAARPSSWIARLAGRRIVDPSELPRERQIEVCALCHGGIGEQKAPAFSYLPGQPLREYLQLGSPSPAEAVDVHGNQVALLAKSACFQATRMTCSTCHDVHETQRDPAAFSQTCLSCHTAGSPLFPAHGASMPGSCVDCHMPELPSNSIISTREGRTFRPRIRTHWIRVYPGTTR